GISTSLLEVNRSLITIRRNSSALRRGTYTPVTCSSPAVFAFLRQSDASQGGPEQVLVAISLGGSGGAVSLNLASASIAGGTTTPQMLMGNVLAPITNANKAAYSFTMPAYGIFIARVGLTITPPPPPPAPPADIDGRNIPVDAGVIGPLG